MAEVLATIVVGPLMSMVKNKDSSYLLDHLDQHNVMEGMEEQHKLLKRKLPAALDVIIGAEEHVAKNREGAKAWLEELQKVDYKANDVLDEFKYVALCRKAKEEGHYNYMELGMDVIKLYISHSRYAFCYRMTNKLCKILQEIDVLITEMNTFRFEFKSTMSLKWRQSNLYISSHSEGIEGQEGGLAA
ncbi:hypothetical protein BS78_10G009800 [Paspalum vaginatum]|nr:hypothetical protein BS78_10G009800 [Paspalum vaginatum]